MIVPPWVYLAGGALALSASFYAGWEVRSWKCEAAAAKVAKATAIAAQKAQRVVDVLSTEYEGERYDAGSQADQVETQIRTIYRDRPVAASCAAPDDARRVLDYAVQSANARATGQSGAPVSGTAHAP